MSEEAILAELKHVRDDFSKMDTRMERMEETLNIVAVQAQQINTLDRDVSKLWQTKEECVKDMDAIKKFQASCPRGTIERDIQVIRDNTKDAIRNQWVAIGLLFTGMLVMAGWIVMGG